jgi:hypothetical protein
VVGVVTHGAENRRRFGVSGVAGGSGGRSDLWTVGKKVVAANTNNGDIEGVRQSLHRIPVELHASGQSVDEALVQAVTQTTKPVAFFDQLHACDAGGRAERDGPRGVFGAWSKAMLLAAATNKWARDARRDGRRVRQCPWVRTFCARRW